MLTLALGGEAFGRGIHRAYPADKSQGAPVPPSLLQGRQHVTAPLGVCEHGFELLVGHEPESAYSLESSHCVPSNIQWPKNRLMVVVNEA